MIFQILTLFPEAFSGFSHGVIAKALEKDVFSLEITDIRQYSRDKHKKCDDYPYGGGAGMVMMPEPIHEAITAVDPQRAARRIFMSPQGKKLCQSEVERLAGYERILLLCGSYEGVDRRVIDADIDEEISIGDFVLTGGEIAAMAVVNAVARYIPGVLGSPLSTCEESFTDNLLEYPQYTRPREFLGMDVPDVLLSGNHAQIESWRAEKRLELTRKLRPDLLRRDEDE